MFLPGGKTNQRRAVQLVTFVLGRNEMLIFAAVARGLSPGLAGAEGEPKRHTDLIYKSPPVGSFLFPSATFEDVLHY